jgi:RHS repeat-associated protein
VNIRRAGNYEEPYKFTGYERDQESGLDNAHDRYYDPVKSINHSTDRHSGNYPSLTSYNYSFNNPIMYRDPTGKDGEVTEITGEGTKANPHIKTIRAEYYYNKNNLTSEQTTGLNDAISEYNSTQSKQGSEKNGTYTITKYNLSAIGFDTDGEINDAINNSYFKNSNGGNSRYGNAVFSREGEINTEGKNQLGGDNGFSTKIFGNVISWVSEKYGKSVSALAKYTFLHEIGHNLGGEHGDPSPMQSALSFDPIYKKDCMGNCFDGWKLSDGTYLSNKLAPVLINRINNPVGGRQYLNIRGGQ